MTINQAATQVDPTSVSPIVFDVVFSEPVTGFTTGDVTLNSTAGTPLVGTVAGSGTTYTVSVTGMTQDGDVTASLAAGIAQDAATNPNTASTSTDNTVTYNYDEGNPDPLTIATPANIVRPNDPGQAGAVVTWPAPTTTGGTPPVVVTCVPASGSFFPLGATTVTCTATDSEAAPVMELQSESSAPVADAMTAAGTFTVTVLDNEPPTIADLPDLVRTTPNGPVSATFPLPAASDNSGVAPTVTCADPSGTFFGVGVTTVTCTATDGAGNSASSTFTVTVVLDATSPVAPQPTPTGPTISPSGELPETGGTPGRILLTGAGLVLLGLMLRKGRRSARA